MLSDQFIGTDVNSLLHAKKQSMLFSKVSASEDVGVVLFFSQLLGWLVSRILAIFSFFLDIILWVEKALINLREDTLQLFYWGRGNVFALFAQAIGLFVAITVGFAWLVGQGLGSTIDAATTTGSDSLVFATSMEDVVVESGSLTTLLPKELKRIDVEEYVVTYSDTIGGKTLDNIAEKWDITADSIRWANNYSKTYQPKPGTVVKIPPISGSYYTVQPGENLEIISARFKIDQATIAEINFLPEPYTLKSGQQVLLPGIGPQVVVKKVTKKTYTSSFNNSAKNNGEYTPPAGPKFLSWPVANNGGSMSRCWLGQYYHDGIDINPLGSGSSNPTIVASAPGRVTYAGVHCTPGMSYRTVCGGYAWVVEIDHGNGFSTMYGHLKANSLMVRAGDAVQRGQAIAKMGATGTVFGNPGTHLHYQLNHGGFLNKSKLRPVNPGPYMINPKFCG
jgi:murein DD-endopeptidase MepM/ murein hydrolase activator NlpD